MDQGEDGMAVTTTAKDAITHLYDSVDQEGGIGFLQGHVRVRC
jgi:hypothetical protein